MIDFISSLAPFLFHCLVIGHTSALDNETQEEINKAIQNLKGEYTILIVAHRLSTVIDCDKIFVVDEGKIIAEGTHKELIKNCKFYKKLYDAEI